MPRVAFDAPENRGALRHLGDPARLARSVSVAKHVDECAPDAVEQPHLRLGAHPDVVARLWEELPSGLPRDCRWIVHGTPALVHPETGIVFGFGGGTHTYALRLPPRVAAEARAAGAATAQQYPPYPELGLAASRLDLGAVGPEWVFGRWLAAERDWCAAAYAYASGKEP